MANTHNPQLPKESLTSNVSKIIPLRDDTSNAVKYSASLEGGDVMEARNSPDDLINEKLGRAEDRWQHAQELHDQKMELMFEKFDERINRSEELNRALIKNIGENTDRIVRDLSAKTDKLEVKVDDAVKEIKSSNKTVTWAVAGLVITVLVGLIGVIATLCTLVLKI